jgi:predicted nucleic acid-binding protein
LKVALDTNIVAYAEGVDGPELQLRAKALVESLPAISIILPVQVLSELYRVLLRKLKWTRPDIEAAVSQWAEFHAVADVTLGRYRQAVTLATNHQINIFDAVILATAADAGCRLLLSEDMQDGFTWDGCTVCNPFVPKPNPLLERAIHT